MRGKTKRIVSISWVCNIFCQLSSHSGLFSRIYPVEVSLILRVYHVILGVIIILQSYFLHIGLAIHVHFHFSKVGIATYLLLLLCGLAQPPKLLIYISVD